MKKYKSEIIAVVLIVLFFILLLNAYNEVKDITIGDVTESVLEIKDEVEDAIEEYEEENK